MNFYKIGKRGLHVYERDDSLGYVEENSGISIWDFLELIFIFPFNYYFDFDLFYFKFFVSGHIRMYFERYSWWLY